MLNKDNLIYTDDYIVIINKPTGIPIHKNEHMPHDAEYVIKSLGELTGKSIYGVHRLDAKTSGIMVFAFDRETAEQLSAQFRGRDIKKTYHAVVYGKPDDEGVFDFPVKDKSKRKKFNALTKFKTLDSKAYDFPYHDKEQCVISLVEAYPESGKYHQIRQHFGLKRHYILGDGQHGSRQLNKLLQEKIGLNRMMLHASKISFMHPEKEKTVLLSCELPEVFIQLLSDTASADL
ncbi:RluA family pseudouridine synthase [Bacteroidota bacterium]